MHERVLYQNYLKRLLVPAQAAFRQRVARLRLRKELCGSCGTDSFVETYHADYSKPEVVLWLCRKCRATMTAHLPIKTSEQRLKELGVAFQTYDEWRNRT